MNNKILAALAALSFSALSFGSSEVGAMPLAPVGDAVSTPIEKTYGGCGVNGHRGPYGGCRFGGQRQVWNARRGFYGRPYRRW
jgi:hypothetical protein